MSQSIQIQVTFGLTQMRLSEIPDCVVSFSKKCGCDVLAHYQFHTPLPVDHPFSKEIKALDITDCYVLQRRSGKCLEVWGCLPELPNLQESVLCLYRNSHCTLDELPALFCYALKLRHRFHPA